MSDLGKITNAPRTDIIEGVAVPRARLVDYAMVEESFERELLARAGSAAVGLPEPIGNRVIAAAVDKVASGHYRYGRPGFTSLAWSITNLPFMAYVLLRHNGDKDMTVDKARKLLPADEAEQFKIQVNLMQQYGYMPQTKDEGSSSSPNGGAATTNPTGGNSPPPSENAE